jgi:hypothetical protein
MTMAERLAVMLAALMDWGRSAFGYVDVGSLARNVGAH